jgi:predicted RNA-binding Zn-ribbon protein involved in translation (DUF1610 family)
MTVRGFNRPRGEMNEMLICIMCGKTIIQNEKPVHYAVCSHCDVMQLTESQKKRINGE